MKNLALSFAVLLAFAGALSAQVRVEVMMDHDQFLPNESIPVKVRIVNNSGQTIRFGQEMWLDYSIEPKDGSVVLKTGDVPIAHDFEIKPAEMGTARADLGPCFNISKPGHYSVVATVHIQDWNKNVVSAPKTFDVISGVRLWDQEIGVPQSPVDHGQPEVRKFILQQATLSRQMKLYFRLTDVSETKSMRVFPVGPMISFSDPQMRVDGTSNLHLLYQSGAHVYNYCVINIEGDTTVRQTYYYGNSAPHLKVTEDGNIAITGGVRHMADNDLPRTRKSLLTNDIPSPVP